MLPRFAALGVAAVFSVVAARFATPLTDIPPSTVHANVLVDVADTLVPSLSIAPAVLSAVGATMPAAVTPNTIGAGFVAQSCGQSYALFTLSRKGAIIHTDSISVFVCRVPISGDTTVAPPSQ